MTEVALVTGGGGFVGTALVKQLRARGDEVRTLARGDYPHLAELGATHMRADLSDASAVAAACEGVDTVYHVAAKAGIWGPYKDYYRANVMGTQAVLAGCRAHRVPRLVYCSTPSVIFGDGKPHDGPVDESTPYPPRYLSHYGTTKGEAERAVLAANGKDGLVTVALRPHLIWGPGDPHILPRIIERARNGRLRIIGDGTNIVSFTYVDNAAHAHVCAGDALREHGPDSPAAGKPYFVGQAEPIRVWEWINQILTALDVPPITKRVSVGTAMRLGAVLEFMWTAFRLGGEPPMTRFVAGQLSMSHSYRIDNARRDLGYEPLVSDAEGFERTIAHFKK